MLAGANDNLSDIAFQYGRNVGLAFQLVDDLLDFVSSAEAMGKPTAADLKLGLATAPVLFACEKVCTFRLHLYYIAYNRSTRAQTHQRLSECVHVAVHKIVKSLIHHAICIYLYAISYPKCQPNTIQLNIIYYIRQ